MLLLSISNMIIHARMGEYHCSGTLAAYREWVNWSVTAPRYWTSVEDIGLLPIYGDSFAFNAHNVLSRFKLVNHIYGSWFFTGLPANNLMLVVLGMISSAKHVLVTFLHLFPFHYLIPATIWEFFLRINLMLLIYVNLRLVKSLPRRIICHFECKCGHGSWPKEGHVVAEALHVSFFIRILFIRN